MANFKRLSRYSKKEIDSNRDGKQFLILRQPLNLEPDSGDIYVTINQELLQRPDLIASKAYGNVELWWVIYEFNSISDPLFELKIGQTIRLPSLPRVQAALANTR